MGRPEGGAPWFSPAWGCRPEARPRQGYSAGGQTVSTRAGPSAQQRKQPPQRLHDGLAHLAHGRRDLRDGRQDHAPLTQGGPVGGERGQRAHHGLGLPLPGRRGPRRRSCDGGPDRVADLPGQPLVERVRQEARQEQESRSARARRPGPSGLHHTAGPNQLWLTDITEHFTAEGKLYLCAVKDVFSKRIVGYSIDSRMKSSLAVAALNNAVARRRPRSSKSSYACCNSPVLQRLVELAQFRSRRFVRALGRHQTAGSIGRVGAAGETRPWSPSSACCRRTSLTDWTTRQELRIAIVT